MAQSSVFWTTGTTGDGTAPYGQSQLFAWLKRSFLGAPASEGVLKGYAGDLAVSGTATPISVAAGAAVVNGVPYESDAPENIIVPTPLIGTTGHRVVLRADYAAKTVRLALLSSSDGVASAPAVTQADDTTWEVSLATLTVTTGGTITVTDTRSYAHFRTAVDASMLDASAVTSAKLADGAVTQAKMGTDTLRWMTVTFHGIQYAANTTSTPAEAFSTATQQLDWRIKLNTSKLPTGARIRFRAYIARLANDAGVATVWLRDITDVHMDIAGSTLTAGPGPAGGAFYESGDLAAQFIAGERVYVPYLAATSSNSGCYVYKAELLIDW